MRPVFVGPSYPLATGKADRQRSVNLFLQRIETDGKAKFILQSVPGLATFAASLGEPIRGTIEVGTRAFAIAGAVVYELHADGTTDVLGSISTTSGPVSMAYGLFQLVIADGGAYAFSLATNTFQTVTDEDFPGADTVDFYDNYFVFTRDRDGQQLFISAINDATDFDALDFASAESSPDDIVGHITVQSGVLVFGTLTTELFINTGAADFPLERSRGSGFRVGLVARGSLQRFDNGAAWLGRDETGDGIVYRISGGQPQRISQRAVEEALRESTDLAGCTSYAYQDQGFTFYVLKAPGLKSVWVYEVSANEWHERCDIDSLGEFIADRANCHMFAFGKHIVGGSDGVLYRMDPEVYAKGADPLVRERVSPHLAAVAMERQFINEFILDTETGRAQLGVDPYVELSWADYGNGPAGFGNPVLRSLGKTGEQFARLVWRRLGMSRDRVWKLRFGGNAPFSIINVEVK